MTSPEERPTIIAAAVHYEVTFSLPPPARHHTILHSIGELLHIPDEVLALASQGFLTSDGKFVNRVEAFYIASRAGQIGAKDTPTLYSEDLW